MARREHEYELVPLKDAKGNVVKVVAREVAIPQLTRAQRKSLKEIPLTPGPQTKWQKFKRAAVG